MCYIIIVPLFFVSLWTIHSLESDFRPFFDIKLIIFFYKYEYFMNMLPQIFVSKTYIHWINNSEYLICYDIVYKDKWSANYI